jgi:hypothetical protein
LGVELRTRPADQFTNSPQLPRLSGIDVPFAFQHHIFQLDQVHGSILRRVKIDIITLTGEESNAVETAPVEPRR